MKSAILLATSGILLASGWLGWLNLPSFDWKAAVIVGAIVTVAAVVILAAAIATPFVAIQAGATLLGTAISVGTIALITGIIGGIAAGLYWGHQKDREQKEIIETIKRTSNRLDIYFEPSSDDPKQAAEFRCTLVIYEETMESSRPTATTKKVKINAASNTEFFEQLDREMKRWFARQVEGDKDRQPRRVMIYMKPYPGEGIYERLKQLAEMNGIRKCIVNKIEGNWVSALRE